MLFIMKKILLSLFVWLIWLINFWYCDYINNLQFLRNVNQQESVTYLETIWNLWVPDEDWQICIYIKSFWWSNRFIFSFNSININNRIITDMNFVSPIFWCIVTKQWYSNYSVGISDAYWDWLPFNVDFYFLSSDNSSVISWSPFYTSLQCQTEYNLIPISSVNQDYCVNNWLCPSGGGDCSWSWDNWSALYINDIQHLWKPIINITFPDYLDWDYTSTWDEFNLDIVWYPVDTEYIDWIIRTQNYKPTSEDFTQLVWMLAPYSKYLLFLLFVFIIWAWIKKPFKSKKL